MPEYNHTLIPDRVDFVPDPKQIGTFLSSLVSIGAAPLKPAISVAKLTGKVYAETCHPFLCGRLRRLRGFIPPVREESGWHYAPSPSRAAKPWTVPNLSRAYSRLRIWRDCRVIWCCILLATNAVLNTAGRRASNMSAGCWATRTSRPRKGTCTWTTGNLRRRRIWSSRQRSHAQADECPRRLV